MFQWGEMVLMISTFSFSFYIVIIGNSSTTTPPPSPYPCDVGWTTVGSKCYMVVTTSANYLQVEASSILIQHYLMLTCTCLLQAILGCVASGATLATVSSQTEQDSVLTMTWMWSG